MKKRNGVERAVLFLKALSVIFLFAGLAACAWVLINSVKPLAMTDILSSFMFFVWGISGCAVLFFAAKFAQLFASAKKDKEKDVI